MVIKIVMDEFYNGKNTYDIHIQKGLFEHLTPFYAIKRVVASIEGLKEQKRDETFVLLPINIFVIVVDYKGLKEVGYTKKESNKDVLIATLSQRLIRRLDGG
jgi:hypothetical protein